jgi:hypothetical protein
MSNITVVYGYGFGDLDRKDFDAITDFECDLPGAIQVFTGYSVSAYDPDTAVIGVPVMPDITMFDPTELTNNLNDQNRSLVDQLQIPSRLRQRLINQQPKFLVYGYSDD